MGNQEHSDFPFVGAGAVMGALAGLFVQCALTVWAVVLGGPLGLLELAVAGVVALTVAGVGAFIGAFGGAGVRFLVNALIGRKR